MLTIYTGLPVTPAAAAKYSWLEPLARAYELVDNAIRIDLDARSKSRLPPPVCRAGCHACCQRMVIDVSQIEMQGLSWYAAEILSGPHRTTVKKQLRHHQESTVCPFLVDGDCAVYPARPLTCRHFHVIKTPCASNEDVVRSRPDDVVFLGASATNDVKTILLQAMSGPMYPRRNADQRRDLLSITMPLHELPLEDFANLMDRFDDIS